MSVPKKHIQEALARHIANNASMGNRILSQDDFWAQSKESHTMIMEALFFLVQDMDDGSEHQRLSDAVAVFLHEFAPNESGDMPNIMKRLAQEVRGGKR